MAASFFKEAHDEADACKELQEAHATQVICCGNEYSGGSEVPFCGACAEEIPYGDRVGAVQKPQKVADPVFGAPDGVDGGRGQRAKTDLRGK